MTHKLNYRVLPYIIAICRLAFNAEIPERCLRSKLFSVTRTHDELSIVCEQEFVPPEAHIDSDWMALKLEGPFPFAMTGVLASFLQPLALSKIPIFAVSTFDTDYVLVKRFDRDAALAALDGAGHVLKS